MVRRFWQNRLIRGIVRLIHLFFRWLWVWLAHLARMVRRSLRASGHLVLLLIRPRDPNNLFTADRQESDHTQEAPSMGAYEPVIGERRPTLLWVAADGHTEEGGVLDVQALSLWRGAHKTTDKDFLPGIAGANRRFAYLDILATQIKRLSTNDIAELESLIQRLARKWLDVDETFESIPRRNRLDVGRTLRHNIPRYAGRILTFQWATKERPVPQRAKPAKILVIGDVSHSMVHYVSVILYFFHMLNFRFVVDSFIFSEAATHAAPYLNGLGDFHEKVERLVAGAKSWNAGTRFGTALEQVAAQAVVDENTYVIIATDGKVSLQGKEADKIEIHLKALRSRAKQLIFLTPSAEFSDGAKGKAQVSRIGSFQSGFYDIPIFDMGPPLWYGILGRYADRFYLVRTVQDLIDMTENLIFASR